MHMFLQEYIYMCVCVKLLIFDYFKSLYGPRLKSQIVQKELVNIWLF